MFVTTCWNDIPPKGNYVDLKDLGITETSMQFSYQERTLPDDVTYVGFKIYNPSVFANIFNGATNLQEAVSFLTNKYNENSDAYVTYINNFSTLDDPKNAYIYQVPFVSQVTVDGVTHSVVHFYQAIPADYSENQYSKIQLEFSDGSRVNAFAVLLPLDN